MAGKKKKKAVANPARGFATVSQPSKPREPIQSDNEIPSDSQEPSANHSVNGDHSVENSQGRQNVDEVKAIAEMTPDELETHLENAELRNLVEQNASRIKTEATRQASKLQNERRQLRQQADQASIYGLNEVLIDCILQGSTQTGLQVSKSFRSSTSPEIEESQLLQKLWLLQEVLKHLQVKMLDQTLTHVLYLFHHHGVDLSPNSVWGLEEALTWIAGTDGAEDSLPYDADKNTDIDDQYNADMDDDNDDSKLESSSVCNVALC